MIVGFLLKSNASHCHMLKSAYSLSFPQADLSVMVKQNDMYGVCAGEGMLWRWFEEGEGDCGVGNLVLSDTNKRHDNNPIIHYLNPTSQSEMRAHGAPSNARLVWNMLTVTKLLVALNYNLKWLIHANDSVCGHTKMKFCPKLSRVGLAWTCNNHTHYSGIYDGEQKSRGWFGVWRWRCVCPR